jgi:hypothetical protein
MSDKAVQLNAYEDMRILAEALDDVLMVSHAAAKSDPRWPGVAAKLRNILREVEAAASMRGIQLGIALGSEADRPRLRELIASLEGENPPQKHVVDFERLAQQVERSRASTFTRLRGALR